MGYMRHHAIIVTSWKRRRGDDLKEMCIENAHEKAKEIMSVSGRSLVSNIVCSATNGYASFFIAPDGSKEGWDDSREGDLRRSAFIEWMESQRYDDGSSPFDWVEIQYGDERHETVILNDSDARYR